jgi:hypothetical protein
MTGISQDLIGRTLFRVYAWVFIVVGAVYAGGNALGIIGKILRPGSSMLLGLLGPLLGIAAGACLLQSGLLLRHGRRDSVYPLIGAFSTMLFAFLVGALVGGAREPGVLSVVVMLGAVMMIPCAPLFLALWRNWGKLG